MASEYPQVDRRERLSVSDFNECYRNPGRPVVITDAAEDWNAVRTWTFEFFKSTYGGTRIVAYEYNHIAYRPYLVKQMTLGEYIDGVITAGRAFPYYIRDNWALLREHPELSADYHFPKYFFDWYSLLPGFMRLPYPRIFIGPSGATTPLHEDIWGTHAWLTQLVGRKRWILFPPGERRLLGDFREPPDGGENGTFPCDAKGVECTIGPGDTIFVPSRWSHYVVSLDPTISLSSNYMGPGCFVPAFSNAARELVLKRAWNMCKHWISHNGGHTESAH
jgi:hypothetical protein